MLKQLLKSQTAAVWYVLLVLGLPLVTLVALGLIMLWQNNWLIMVSVVWLVVTLAGFTIYQLWPKTMSNTSAVHPSAAQRALQDTTRVTSTIADTPHDDQLKTDLPLRLEPRTDWTALDRRVWLHAIEAVELALGKHPPWKELPEVSLELLTAVSEFYALENQLLNSRKPGKTTGTPEKMYSFTLPEVLLVLSITSSRYRHLVLEYIPFADRIKVSSLLNLYARQDQIKTGARWINTIRRTTRFVNPLAAVAAELRDHFTNRIFTNLSDKVQIDLKRLLLQELVQVGMDLYSGRLKTSIEELADYQADNRLQSTERTAIPLEPLRIVLAGQVGSGKSSLVNGLINRLEAETDVLPTTDSTTVHALHWPDEQLNSPDDHNPQEPLHLIDTVGLNDKPESLDSLVDLAQQADLLIWVVRANQPAKAPDAVLYTALQEAYDNQPMRRPAPVLMVLTHIDQLKPKANWHPPYDLGSDVKKAVSIRQSIASCIKQIGLPDNTPVVPVCLASDLDQYNVDMVAAQIMLLQADASQTQLNRRRTHREMHEGTWRDRWNQASNLGTVSGKVLIRSVLGR